MSRKTKPLFGDGRHKRLKVGFEGRMVTVSFENGDLAAETAEWGRDLPEELADKLLAVPGTFVREVGSEPREVTDARQRREAQAQLAREEQAKAENEQRSDSTKGEQAAQQSDFKTPHREMSKQELLEVGLSLGLTGKELNRLNKEDLYTAVRDATIESYPALEDQVEK